MQLAKASDLSSWEELTAVLIAFVIVVALIWYFEGKFNGHQAPYDDERDDDGEPPTQGNVR